MEQGNGVERSPSADSLESPERSNYTETQRLQAEVEDTIFPKVYRYLYAASRLDLSELVFLRKKHVRYIRSVIESLGPANEYLDASRPWILYWTLNSLTLLGDEIDEDLSVRTARALQLCRDPFSGAYCGGECQIPHLGVTYAAICVLSILGEPYISSLVNRSGIMSWMLKLRQPDGSFAIHEGGEIDLRGTYCAVAVSDMLNLKFEDTEEIGNFIASCQTYEGGLAGSPGAEAHGGYTYCGLAALMILNQENKINAESMAGSMSGGFCGRTNKIVDGCYSFWQGAVTQMLTIIFDSRRLDICSDFFNRESLQVFLLTCCQHESGGFSDRPDRAPDIYHTCYCISGYSLSTTVHARCTDTSTIKFIRLRDIFDSPDEFNYCPSLEVTHPYYNVRVDFVDRIKSLYR